MSEPSSSAAPTQETVLRAMLLAKTPAQVANAQAARDKWLSEHPDGERIFEAGERLEAMAEAHRATNQSTSDWLSVAEAAAALKVSERTARRRCEAGKLAARLVTTENGRQWRVDPAAVQSTLSAPAADASDSQSTLGVAIAADRCGQAADISDSLRTASDSTLAARADSVTEAAAIGAATAADGAQSTLVAHLQAEVLFLRGALEQRDRDAAELRAALREALRAMPKALGQSTSEGATDATGGTPPEAVKSPQSVQSTLDGQTPATPPIAPQKPPESKSRAGQSTLERRRGVRGWLLKVLRG